jgi:hypothetical protein
MANLLEFSRDIMARTTEGKEALLAVKALRDWKASAAIRKAHGSVSAYHSILVELHEAGRIKFRGRDFMNTGTKDGADYGLELHQKWVAAGRPGSFKAFVEESKGKGEKPDASAKTADDTAERDRLARLRGLGR